MTSFDCLFFLLRPPLVPLLPSLHVLNRNQARAQNVRYKTKERRAFFKQQQRSSRERRRTDEEATRERKLAALASLTPQSCSPEESDGRKEKCKSLSLSLSSLSNAHDHDHPPRLCEPKRLRGCCSRRSSAAAAAAAAAARSSSSGSSPTAAAHRSVHGRGSSGGAARSSFSDQDVRKEFFFSSSLFGKSCYLFSCTFLCFQQGERRERDDGTRPSLPSSLPL